MSSDPIAQNPVAIVGGLVYPVSSAPILDGTVLIEHGRITAVGADVDVPAGAQIIDAAGKWVLPGLFDSHAHVGLHEDISGTTTSTTPAIPTPRGFG